MISNGMLSWARAMIASVYDPLNSVGRVHSSFRFWRAIPFTVGIALLSHGPAVADVLDVAADGTVTTYARAAAFNGQASGVASYSRGNVTARRAETSGMEASCRSDNCNPQIKQILKGGMVNYSHEERVCDATSCYVFRNGSAIFDGPSRQAAAGLGPAVAPKAAPPVIGDLLAKAAERHALDQRLLSAVAWRESHFQAGAVSSKGAVGVMQLMPETARALGVDQHDTAQNIEGGAAYLRQMLNRYDNNPALALAAYNAGPGAVDRYRTIPPFAETQAYVRGILGDAISWPRSAVIFTAP